MSHHAPLQIAHCAQHMADMQKIILCSLGISRQSVLHCHRALLYDMHGHLCRCKGLCDGLPTLWIH